MEGLKHIDENENPRGLQYQSVQTSLLAAIGDSASPNLVTPQGMGRLRVLLFNPSIDMRVYLKIESSRQVPLDGFSTLIGDRGVLLMDNAIQPTDKLLITITNQQGANQQPVFTFGFA